jgi:phosphonate transport system substrate-binding protein
MWGALIWRSFSKPMGFFCEAVASGAHSTSLKWLLAGRVDGTAIDSTVLEWLSSEHSELSTQIRVIQSIGPSPVPPWVVSTKLTAEGSTRLRRLLCEMPPNSNGSFDPQPGAIGAFCASGR